MTFLRAVDEVQKGMEHLIEIPFLSLFVDGGKGVACGFFLDVVPGCIGEILHSGEDQVLELDEFVLDQRLVLFHGGGLLNLGKESFGIALDVLNPCHGGLQPFGEHAQGFVGLPMGHDVLAQLLPLSVQYTYIDTQRTRIT